MPLIRLSDSGSNGSYELPFFLHMLSRRISDGLLAGGVHLLFSVLIAVIVFLLVQRTWFLPPWGHLMDGDGLLAMVIGVDVICGPFLTGLVVHSAKLRWKNALDISVIASIQLAALVFGLWTAWQAKPSWLVFEGDRFVVVRYADLMYSDEMDRRALPVPRFNGIELKAVNQIAGNDPLFLRSLSLSLQGIPPAYRPGRWVEYSDALTLVSAVARLKPEWSDQIHHNRVDIYPLQQNSKIRDAKNFRFVPLQIGFRTDWVVVLDSMSLQPIALMQVDAWADAQSQ